MEEYYSISRKIIAALAVIISLIMTVNEDISVKIVVPVFILIIAVVATVITAPLSRKMIIVGDGILNLFLKVVYYIAILPVTALVAYVLYWFILMICDEYVVTLSMAVIVLFIIAAMVVVVVVPYIQTLLVLIIRRVSKVKNG